MNLFPFCFLLCLIAGLSTTEPDESTQLYSRSLLQYLSTRPATTVWLTVCEDIEMPAKVGKHRLIRFQSEPGQLKKLKSALVIRLLPLQLNEGDVIVRVVEFAFQPPDRLYFNGREDFRYRYNYTSKQYQLVERKNLTH